MNATTHAHPAHASGHHGAPTSFWSKYLFSTDHKVIGMQYLLVGLLMAVVGGFLAYAFRMQLAFPGTSVPMVGVMTPDQYNAFVTMHGTIMIFWVAMPVLVAAFGNLLIPLMVGTDDMAFPVLNMLSFWVFFVSTLLLLASFFAPTGAFAGGWTAYPPLSVNAYRGLDFWSGLGGNLWILAVALEFVAFLMGGINFLVTGINMRARGMTLFRMPVFIWMMIVAVLVFMFSVGPLVAGAVMLLFDRMLGTSFYNPAEGGDPVLFQHLFWFFGHPEVYVLLLPALGIVAEVITTFARKAIFGYRAIVYSTIFAGITSFIVWAHHQFIAGIDVRMATFFSITTIIISIPFAIAVFSYMATLWRGSIVFTTAMLWALGFLAEFLLGGVTGVFLGSSAFDIYAHDTYFVVAHFHYTLIPIVIFSGMAGIFYWFPKFTGKMLDERLGKIHFWLTAISFNFIFLPLFFNGLGGQHRRIFDYGKWESLSQPWMHDFSVIATGGLIVMASAQILLVINLVKSWRGGAPAAANPWSANTLEWSVVSPPPHGNFPGPVEVYRGAYEFSVPGAARDFLPQHVP